MRPKTTTRVDPAMLHHSVDRADMELWARQKRAMEGGPVVTASENEDPEDMAGSARETTSMQDLQAGAAIVDLVAMEVYSSKMKMRPRSHVQPVSSGGRHDVVAENADMEVEVPITAQEARESKMCCSTSARTGTS